MYCLSWVFQEFLHPQLSLHFHLNDFLRNKILHLHQIADEHIFLQTVIFYFLVIGPRKFSDGSGVIAADARFIGIPGGGRTYPRGKVYWCLSFIFSLYFVILDSSN